MQPAAERVVIAVGTMVRFGMRISRRADVLKIAFGQGRFVLRERRRMARRGGGFARTQKERGESGAEKKKIIPVTQRRRY